ncbi:hypothetical protein [Nonomuraea sp. NPDC048826]|uniref:RNA polymerase sigma factor n=1 Tax=Nonomuraea sp. NPDC048826 TaxID=3364347 RepID=UPI0037214CCB
MTHPLTGQRSRREQIAELYDSHAAGLFVYCADQLGDPGSTADVLVSVLTSAPEDSPRAALYAFARREIHRRDVVYAPPVVDPLVDPASALVERILRELRPQQREVLVLGHVCGLDLAELAWVLDVAPDTAEELVLSAAHRFRQILNMALDASEGRIPKPVADVYGALSVAPLRDVLGRLPWPEPPGTLRIHLAGSSTANPAPLFVKPRWPVPPAWPQPLGEADPATTTGLFPRDLLTPPSSSRVPAHDATTAPMPKYRDAVREGPARLTGFPGASSLAPFPGARPGPSSFAPFPGSRPGPSSSPFPDPRPGPSSPAPFPDPRQGPSALAPVKPERPAVPEPPAASSPFEAFRPRRAAQAGPERPTPRGAKPGMGEPLSAPAFLTGGDLLDDAAGAPPASPAADPPATGDFLVHQGQVREAGPLFVPRTPPKEPVYRMPVAPAAEPVVPAPRPADSPTSPTAAPLSDVSRTDVSRTDEPRTEEARKPVAAPDPLLTKPRPVRKPPARKPPQKGRKPHPAKGRKKKRRNRHHDWAWELIGFLICVAIAMIVFFSVPMIIKP